jgi:dTDP-D-glucose 4,6-dehydratase
MKADDRVCAIDLASEISRALAQANAICAVVAASNHIDKSILLPDDAVLNAMWAARDLIEQAEKDVEALFKCAMKAEPVGRATANIATNGG